MRIYHVKPEINRCGYEIPAIAAIFAP